MQTTCKRAMSGLTRTRGRVLTAACVIVVTILAIGLWPRGPVPRWDGGQAWGQGTKQAPRTMRFDPSKQRQEMVEAVRETNKKLDKLISLLESGKVRVRLIGGPKPEKADANAGKKAK